MGPANPRVVLGVLFVAGAVLVFAFSLKGGLIGQSARGQTGGVGLTDTGLATANRAELTICVDDRDDPASAQMEVEVSGALQSIFASGQHSGVYPVVGDVARGCPPPTALTATMHLTRDLAHSFEGGGVTLVAPDDMPSPHRVFVYLLSSAQYEETFGTEPFTTGTAEFLCFDDVCAAVTTSLYVRAGFDAETLRQGLLDALGLHGRVADPPRDPAEIEEKQRRALTPEATSPTPSAE